VAAVAGGVPAVMERDGSTAEVAWLPLAELAASVLSPAAADGLGLSRG